MSESDDGRECSIDHCQVDLDGPLAGPAHARKHKNEFEDLVGRRPRDYEEVRALFNRGESPDDVEGADFRITALTDFEQESVGDQAETPLTLTELTQFDDDA